MKNLEHYIGQFQNLSVDRSSGQAKPHKVCMLNAVMDLIETGLITDNRILYSELLKQRFSWHFTLLASSNDRNTPHYPFYYLGSADFWHFQFSLNCPQRKLSAVSEAAIQRSIEFAYLDEDLFLLLKNEESRIELRRALVSNLDSFEIQFQQWAVSIGKSEKTARNYTQALKSSIPNWLLEAGVTHSGLLSISNSYEYQRIVTKAHQVREFKEYNKRGKGMYAAALNAYGAFLEDITQAQVKSDIDEIQRDTNIQDTQKSVLINSRIGQGKFREDLIRYWKGCSVTQYPKLKFLVASHIKPWAKSSNAERLDPYNGLLLLANLDKAFEWGYISFSDKGKILISEQLDDYHEVGIREDMSVRLLPEHQEYLAYHRETTFGR